jgi:hypothetical protein
MDLDVLSIVLQHSSRLTAMVECDAVNEEMQVAQCHHGCSCLTCEGVARSRDSPRRPSMLYFVTLLGPTALPPALGTVQERTLTTDTSKSTPVLNLSMNKEQNRLLRR